MAIKTAVITGITGQDGAYLAQLLLTKGYKVFGTYRRTSTVNFWRLNELSIQDHPKLQLVEYDLTDMSSALRLIEMTDPDEFYNLAAQSFVGVSFDQPLSTGMITGLSVVHILEAIRVLKPSIKFYQASTSEMFGHVQAVPQTETTPFYPRSPYGVAKLYAHWMTINYRESYNLFATSGILFNHESPLRGLEFVTRKITNHVAQISLAKAGHMELGNLNAKRDWGYAKDYVKGMYAMLQIETPDSFILATNRTETVREFLMLAFKAVDIPIEFRGHGVDEQGLNANTGEVLVKVNPKYFRPAEVELLIGNAAKAHEVLGWVADTSLEELCSMMVNADVKRNSDE